MIHSLLALALSLQFTPTTHLSDSFEDHRYKTEYDSGTLPTAPDLAGWWSGRCWMNDAPINALVVTWEKDSVTSYALLSNSQEPEDYFDHITPADYPSIDQYLQSLAPQPGYESEQALRWDYRGYRYYARLNPSGGLNVRLSWGAVLGGVVYCGDFKRVR